MKKLIFLFSVGLFGLLLSCEDTVYGKSVYKYEVTGTATQAKITMNDGNETTVQHIVDLPWSYAFEKDNMWSFNLFLSAQNQGEDGTTITVRIYRNDKVEREATSSGAYSIASVSYSWGE